MHVKKALFEETGGPEVIQWVEAELAPPAPGEVRMRNTAIGLNYIDTYHRSGLYPIALPSGLGMEAAGVIEAVGEGVEGWRPGDRVATFGPILGAYATARNLPASALFAIADDIDDEMAAAGLLKGCTTEFLVERCAHVKPGWDILVHAAAGGVGLLLVQWLKHIGARVIGTVSTEEKAELARAAGADHVILYGREEVSVQVRALTNGKGVEVCFDGVGQATWDASLDSTARRGMIASYGNASGAVNGINLGILAAKGSLFVTRPTLFDYYRQTEERAAGAQRVFSMLRQGALKMTVGQRYPLEKAAQAHRDLEARKTTGSTLLLP